MIEVLTFDCYGTLIDWEAGILSVWKPLAESRGVAVTEPELLKLYAELEAKVEAGPYKPYRDVLAEVTTLAARRLGFEATPAERARLAESLPTWKPFPDTVAALAKLARRFDLGVISNVDADLFEGTQELLGRPFRYVTTADHVLSYKPSPKNFVEAVQAMQRPLNTVLHCAQSVYHDIIPAKVLGFRTARVDRASRCPGVGVAPAAEAQADFTAPDLAALAEML